MKYHCCPDDYLKPETGRLLTKFGHRTFEYARPRLRNSLPLKVRTEEDIENYKRQLKTLHFTDTERIKRKAFQYE